MSEPAKEIVWVADIEEKKSVGTIIVEIKIWPGLSIQGFLAL